MGYFEGIKVPVFENLEDLIDSGESHRTPKTIHFSGDMIEVPVFENLEDLIDSGESHRTPKTIHFSGGCIQTMKHVHFRTR
jgi:hypothetical protein